MFWRIQKEELVDLAIQEEADKIIFGMRKNYSEQGLLTFQVV